MSNFTKEELYRIYDVFLPHFNTLAKEASQNNVYLSVDLTSDGTIILSSRQYAVENNKEIIRTHTITHGKDFVSEETKTNLVK